MYGFMMITLLFICAWRCTPRLDTKPLPFWHYWSAEAQAARAQHIAEWERFAIEWERLKLEHRV